MVLAACSGSLPRLKSPPPQPSQNLASTVVQSFAQLNADSYPELRSPPAHGVTVDSLRKRHDTFRYTESRVLWGEKAEFSVLQFSDTDRPTRAVSPVSAWFLGPDPGDGAPEVVGAVLFRDFAGAPTAADPYQLLGQVAEQFPAPWLICRPAALGSADLLLAYDEARGLKLALHRSGAGEQLWSVDHVEYISTLLPIEVWWMEKGYETCPIEDRVL